MAGKADGGHDHRHDTRYDGGQLMQSCQLGGKQENLGKDQKN
jgi:hypothetical protein